MENCIKENLNGECIICDHGYYPKSGLCIKGDCGVSKCELCQEFIGLT